MAGARTAAIAEAAGVNKALLYYYFKDKESLYSASLQAVFSGLVEDVLPLLESPLSPGEKILRLARVHFEYLIHHPNYPRLIQQELSRAGNMGEPSKDFRAISAAHFIPLQRAGLKAIEEGISSGEFREVEGAGTLRTIFAMNVFYFISAPIMRLVRGADPFSAECIRQPYCYVVGLYWRVAVQGPRAGNQAGEEDCRGWFGAAARVARRGWGDNSGARHCSAGARGTSARSKGRAECGRARERERRRRARKEGE